MENKILVQTQSLDNYEDDKRITSKQWKIYYYMISVSQFNAQSIQKYYYIYKKHFNITKVCRNLGIKSIQTFYNALKKLEEQDLIKQDESCYFLFIKNWIEIDKDVLIGLLKCSKEDEKDIDLLRIYLILKKNNKNALYDLQNDFTIRKLCTMLGHSNKTSSYYKSIRYYLEILNYWGLIKLSLRKEYNENLKKNYSIYHVDEIKEELSEDFKNDIYGEMQAKIQSKAFLDKILIYNPDAIEI